MSAGICGKRVGFEELFVSSPKRFRYSGYESSDPGSIPDDPVSTFSSLDSEVKTSGEPHGIDSMRIGNCSGETAACSRISDCNVEDVNDIKHKFFDGNAVESPNWTDLFVHEMMSATNVDDARARATRILEAFEGSVTANKRAAEEIEHVSLKEHSRSLLDNNQILRRAVAIQHERNVEQEGKEREVQHLKCTLNQYVEQARTLELNNYTLKLHLQRAQQSSSIKGQFPPDIY